MLFPAMQGLGPLLETEASLAQRVDPVAVQVVLVAVFLPVAVPAVPLAELSRQFSFLFCLIWGHTLSCHQWYFHLVVLFVKEGQVACCPRRAQRLALCQEVGFPYENVFLLLVLEGVLGWEMPVGAGRHLSRQRQEVVTSLHQFCSLLALACSLGTAAGAGTTFHSRL